MAKQTKETYHAQGKADHAAVKLGNHYALARQAWANGSQSWQANAYRDGMQEAQDIENGYFEPERVWMRTPHAERLAILHRANCAPRLAGKAFSSIGPYAQVLIAAVINGEPGIDAVVPASALTRADVDPTQHAWNDGEEDTPAPVAQSARDVLVSAMRQRAMELRIKHDCIKHLKPGKRLQGPRHAPGLCWPSGERVARSHFVRRDTWARPTPSAVYVWQWVAFNEAGEVLTVVEFSDLWTVREIAAYSIADMYRFVRSHKGH